MLIANKVVPLGRGLAPALLRRAASLTLDWDTRQKSRFDADDSTGRRVAAVLPRGTLLRGGDVLVGEDGTLIRVDAAPQPVLRVTAAEGDAAPRALLRAAYHLGNRHVALEVHAAHLQLEADHVLAAMLRQMGLVVDTVDTAFEPEAGAYAADHEVPALRHGHGHGHGHGSAPLPAVIEIRAAASASHVHGPGCGHSHG